MPSKSPEPENFHTKINPHGAITSYCPAAWPESYSHRAGARKYVYVTYHPLVRVVIIERLVPGIAL